MAIATDSPSCNRATEVLPLFYFTRIHTIFGGKGLLPYLMKSMIGDVPHDQIGGSKTHSVSPARKLRSIPGFPHISLKEMSHARMEPSRRFSTPLNLIMLRVMQYLAYHGFKIFELFHRERFPAG
jgi:hypothetical protein